MDPPFPSEMLPVIERYLANEAQELPQDWIVDAVYREGLFMPLQRKNELRRMLELAAAQNPRTLMEIGADKGGGFYHWIKCLPTLELAIAAEIRGTPYSAAFERTFRHIEFGWLPESSYAPAGVDKVRRQLNGRTLDVLFIDGDKSNFLADFQAYLPMLSPQALVLLHDIRDPGPGAAFRQLQTLYYTAEIIDTTEAVWALARERAGIPPSGSYEGWLRHWKGASCGVGVVFVNLPRG